MDYFLPSFIFIFGLIIGSFLGCVIYRLEKGEGFSRGRSYCPHCEHTLSWQDLIPVLSFIRLGGECRYCRKKISWQYPLVEISTGFLFVLIAANFRWPYSIFYFLLSTFLIVIFVYDLKHYLIPDKVIYPAILVFGIWYFVAGIFLNLYTRYEILNTIYAALAAAGFFAAIVLFSKGRWMGLGDVKLAVLMGLMLGFPDIIVALFSAFLVGAIMGIGLIIFGKKTMKSEVPFGPFLVLGTIIALFWAKPIINWYLSFYV